jgi:glycosyltransferase involved in cell wall biosynthesis
MIGPVYAGGFGSICGLVAHDREPKKGRVRVLLIGPCPPPECGTSIPFRALIEFLVDQSALEPIVISSTSGSKRGIPLLSRRVLGPFVRIAVQFLKHAGSCDRFVFYGSQRFAATAGALFTLIAAGILGKDASIYIQGGGFDVFYRSRPPIARALVRFCFRRARAVAVQTRQLKASLDGEFPNLIVLPNWSTLRSAAPDAPSPPAETSGAGVRFLYLGQVKREKGIDELVRSFIDARTKLLARGCVATLDIYGPNVDGAIEAAMPVINESGGSIVYHGNAAHDRILSILCDHDVLVLPTRWPTEGYPAVVIEAMAVGRAVIASRFRAIPEIVIDGSTGLLCEPGDSNSLTQCMVRLALDPGLRERMGIEARAMAARFDAGTVLPDLCRAFGIPLLR